MVTVLELVGAGEALRLVAVEVLAEEEALAFFSGLGAVEALAKRPPSSPILRAGALEVVGALKMDAVLVAVAFPLPLSLSEIVGLVSSFLTTEPALAGAVTGATLALPLPFFFLSPSGCVIPP